MAAEMLTPAEKEEARDALLRIEIRADWVRTHLEQTPAGQVQENLQTELDRLTHEIFMLRTVLQPPVAPTGHRLLPVRANAMCQHCRSKDVAWYRSPRTNFWQLFEIVRHASSTVSGLFLDIDQPHACQSAAAAAQVA
jgi:hypothetical protein